MEPNLVLKQIIEQRKSIFPKDYIEQEIPQTVVNEILSAADSAPNHKRTKPWRFKVFRGSAKQQLGEELQMIYKTVTHTDKFLPKKYDDIISKMSKANVVVSIVVDFSGLVPEWEEIAATAMAVQNMYLTCTANNIGCYWSSPKLVDHLKHALLIGKTQRCLGLFYMGSVA